MIKTWLRYFFYFLCPLAVVYAGWLYHVISDRLFSVADRGASLLLGLVGVVLAAGISFYVAHNPCRSMEYRFSVSSERQKKRMIDRIQTLLREELPAESRIEPRGNVIFDGSYSIFVGMHEKVYVEAQPTVLIVQAPKKLMELIAGEMNAIDPSSSPF